MKNHSPKHIAIALTLLGLILLIGGRTTTYTTLRHTGYFITFIGILSILLTITSKN